MNEWMLLVIWLLSLPAAALIGIDRGRWWEATLLGLALGPFGVIAAGQLQPSLEVLAQRQYQLARAVGERHRRAADERRKRLSERASLDAWVEGVSQPEVHREVTFAERLEELSEELARIEAASDAPDATRMREWSNWLRLRADDLRATRTDTSDPREDLR